MKESKIVFKQLSYDIVGLAMQVRNELGFGFAEKVYENALTHLLIESGLNALQQVEVEVYFRNIRVGKYRPDIVVENKIILELKAIKHVTDLERAQTLNYLKATNFQLGIILNFARSGLQHERLVL